MKVGIFFGYAPPELGAAVTRAVSISGYLESLGIEVTMIAPTHGHSDFTGSVPVRRFKDQVELASKVAEENLDAAIVSTPPLDYARWAALELRRQNIPYLADVRDPGSAAVYAVQGHTLRSRFSGLKAWVKEGQLLRLASASTAVSEPLRHLMMRRHPIAARGMDVAPNGAEPEMFHPISQEQRQQIRSKISVPDDRPLIVYAGSIGRELELFDFIVKCGPALRGANASLLIIALSDSQDSLARLYEVIESSAAPDLITVLENLPQEEVAAILPACDVGLTAVADEFKYAIQIKVYEYILSGVPVLAKGPSGGGLDRIFGQDEDTGWIFHSWKDVAANLSHILDSSISKRSALTSQAREYARLYSRDVANRIFADRIKSELSGGRL
jgi:glycosyltransferase involved in cell wall biosynthesis